MGDYSLVMRYVFLYTALFAMLYAVIVLKTRKLVKVSWKQEAFIVVSFAIVGFLAMAFAVFTLHLRYYNGNLFIITILLLYFSRRSALIEGLILVAMSALLYPMADPSTVVKWTIIREALTLVTAYFIIETFRNLYERHMSLSFSRYALVLAILLTTENRFWTLLLDSTRQIRYLTSENLVLIFIAMPFIVFVALSMFAHTIEQHARVNDLAHAKDKLKKLVHDFERHTRNLELRLNSTIQEMEQLMRDEQRYQLIFEAGNEAAWEYDAKTDTYTLSEAYCNLFDYTEEDADFIIRHQKDMIHQDDQVKFQEYFWKIHQHPDLQNICEFRIKTRNGDYRWVEAKTVALLDNMGKVIRLAGTLHDINQERQQREELERYAYRDDLTGLYNRRFLTGKLHDLIQDLPPENSMDESISVIYIGLDNFKSVNETMGHESGDEVLWIVSDRLCSGIHCDCLLSRFVGDEFVLLVTPEQDVYQISKNIQTTMLEPIHYNGLEILLTASMGIATYPKDGTDEAALLKNAHTAMHFAKRTGRNQIVHFDEAMISENMERLGMEISMRKGLASGEFTAHFQSQVNLQTGAIVGFEVLARWHSQKYGDIPPTKFIPIAENNGLIVELGKYMLREASRFLHNVPEEITVSVNISSVQLNGRSFVEDVISIVAEEGVSPERILLEVTESAVMENFEACLDRLKTLRDRGFRISMDDFGTGYSSLTYLRYLPAHEVKLDRTFLMNLTTDVRQQKLTNSIIELCHELDMKVVAEGIESLEQAELLTEMGTDFGQGYYYSRPQPIDVILEKA